MSLPANDFTRRYERFASFVGAGALARCWAHSRLPYASRRAG
jgi:hypothetical protein